MTKLKEKPDRVFIVKNNEYQVFKKEGKTIIKSDGKVVFDSSKSKLKYFEWVKIISN